MGKSEIQKYKFSHIRNLTGKCKADSRQFYSRVGENFTEAVEYRMSLKDRHPRRKRILK